MAIAGALPPKEYDRVVRTLRQNQPACLAPKMRERVEASIAECNGKGLDVVTFETCRTDELARLYYEHGVSKSPNALYTWHHYGLAVDVISRSREWDVYPDQDGNGGDPDWYLAVVEIFKAHGLDWGGDWIHFKDWPHWQFGGLNASPKTAPRILATDGIIAVWEAVGAA